MTYYIYSTLTCSQNYCDYYPSPDQHILPQVKSKIHIAGGHGVAGKHLITPRGVVTKITDEQYEILSGNPEFQLHMKNGFITAEKHKIEPEKAIRAMENKDKSAPLTPNDYSKRVPVIPGTEDVQKPKPSTKKIAA